MKLITYENTFNKEKFTYNEGEFRPEVIDGIEFIRVRRLNSDKVCLMRKEYLEKIDETEI